MANTVVKALQPIILCLLAIGLMGCIVSNDSKIHHINGPIMGTWYNVKFQALPSSKNINEIKGDVDAVLNDINQKMSTYLSESELSKFNRVDINTSYQLSKETIQVLKISEQVHRESQGAFDISVGPLVNLWGFGPEKRDEVIPTSEALLQAMQNIGASSLVLTLDSAIKAKALQLDLSAVAKGYAVDRVAQALESIGIHHYMVEVGGELRVGKRKLSGGAWKIAIEEPVSIERSVQKVLALESISVATSGDYRNYYESDGKRYSHTIDPRVGTPVNHTLASVTVLHRSCAYADAYATAITVLGPEHGMALARKLNLAVYMLVKAENGFDVLQTKSFSDYVDSAAI